MYFNELVASYDESRRERNVFHDLMRYRVREILLVGSLYDSFVVEADGILNEQIYGEWYKLNLNTVPRISTAYTDEIALDLFATGRFDLVILMAGLEFDGPLALAAEMKRQLPGVAVLLMATNNTSLLTLDRARPELAAVDKVFVWNGYSKLFVGMIKYVEDLRNVDGDTRTGLIRVILLIEDSVRYYSRYLPLLYQVVMRQTQALIEEEHGVETYKLLRSHARPKVLLASNWDEAMTLFSRYEPYILSVISDLSFPRSPNSKLAPTGERGGKSPGEDLGFEFLEMARSRIKDLPVMIQSSEAGVRERALAMGAAFADKNSESLEHELGHFLRDSLGFGGFRFRNAVGEVIAEAGNIDAFIKTLAWVPPESVLFHAGRNNFSTWLMARGEIESAKLLRNYRIDDFPNTEELRGFLMRVLVGARKDKSKGMIPPFDEAICQDENCMTRLADGSVGGKGRGLVFIRSLLENLDFKPYLGDLHVRIPRTTFIGIDAFELYLERNFLWSFAYYDGSPEEVRERFLYTELPDSLLARLRTFLRSIDSPLAVRSSGLFEDMLMVPFSGIYETYIIPNSHRSLDVRVAQLSKAIRLIYASLFSAESRAYFDMARYNLEEERMAIVIQELVGKRRGRWYYPHASGTAQSYNYYPVSYAKPEDGLCVSALGLGSYVVDGLPAFRFCPRYPKLNVMHAARLRSDSQRLFRALDMESPEPELEKGEDASLADLPLSEAEADPFFSGLASTWDSQNERLVPGTGTPGMRVMDLGPILQYDSMPFATAIDMVLEIGAKSMGTPVEIEYALNLDEPDGAPCLYLLQLKPLIHGEERVDVDLAECGESGCFIVSGKAMGNGRDETIRDVIWVDHEGFDRSRTEEVAKDVEELDRELGKVGRRYILVGPGRWGTRDRWLGIPVNFGQITRARAIVETEMPGFSVDFSFGSHFFHNVTSMGVGYLTVPEDGGNYIDMDWLRSFDAVKRVGQCVWTELPEPLELLMDGRKSRAVVRKGGSGS